MSTESTLESSAAAPNAQEISKRVLALIENIHGQQDISPETIEKYTGQKVWINPDNENDYSLRGKLTEQWYYGLRSLSPEQPGQKPNGLLFQFNDQTNTDPDMSPVCVPLENYSVPLTAAGFTAKRSRDRLDTQDIWDFSRGSLRITVYLRGKNKPLDAQTCISMVIIGVNS